MLYPVFKPLVSSQRRSSKYLTFLSQLCVEGTYTLKTKIHLCGTLCEISIRKQFFTNNTWKENWVFDRDQRSFEMHFKRRFVQHTVGSLDFQQKVLHQKKSGFKHYFEWDKRRWLKRISQTRIVTQCKKRQFKIPRWCNK